MKSKRSGWGCKSMLGTPEEVKERELKRLRRKLGLVVTKADAIRRGVDRPITIKSPLDVHRIKALYTECERLNWCENLTNEPWNKWVVDHILSVAAKVEDDRGFVDTTDIEKAEPGNLRLARRWANGARIRTVSEISELREAVILCLFETGWPRTIDWGTPRWGHRYTQNTPMPDETLPIKKEFGE